MRLRRPDPDISESKPEWLRARGGTTEGTLRALEKIGVPRTPPPDAQERECGDLR